MTKHDDGGAAMSPKGMRLLEKLAVQSGATKTDVLRRALELYEAVLAEKRRREAEGGDDAE